MDCTEDICEETAVPKVLFKDGAEITCPPTKPSVGRCGWGLLHTLAAHYPDNPSDEWIDTHNRFYLAFSKVYPCKSCAVHFNYLIKQEPPELQNRAAISLWTCKMHNEINKMLNKEIFPCELENLDQRWRKGKPPCTSTINNV
jgi:mitochondrial FAD-linked sulfhydryl oxidase